MSQEDWVCVDPLFEFENLEKIKMFSCRDFLLDLQQGFIKEAENEKQKVTELVESQLERDFHRMDYYWKKQKITESLESFKKERLEEFSSSCPHFWPLFCLVAGQQIFARPHFWLLFEIFQCPERQLFLTNFPTHQPGQASVHFDIVEDHLQIVVYKANILIPVQESAVNIENDDYLIVHSILMMKLPLKSSIHSQLKGSFRVKTERKNSNNLFPFWFI